MNELIAAIHDRIAELREEITDAGGDSSHMTSLITGEITALQWVLEQIDEAST